MQGRSAIAVGVVLLAVAASCQEFRDRHKAVEKPPILYHRVGGIPVITEVVDTFVGKIADDELVSGRFAQADVSRLKWLLVEQVCEATGGPCVYTGQRMREVHQGMGITSEEFRIIASHFSSALEASGIGGVERETIMKSLVSMRDDIVGL